MYHPYFRGKQFELVAIRENAELLGQIGFVPIIEPVRESLTGLKRTLEAIVGAAGEVVLIVNPHHGDHAEDAAAITDLVDKEFPAHPKLSVGVLATEGASVDAVIKTCAKHATRPLTLIHAGATDARGIAARLVGELTIHRHVFIEEFCGKLYRKHFISERRVLVRDGFKRRSNREHPEVEFFSDLHATFSEENVSGFGDFLVVGDDYSEAGGPAYAVAIHLTYIDKAKDDGMYVYHFVSDRTDTPADPAGKFAEALVKLVAEVNSTDTCILRTKAVQEFLGLHERRHFPGLGYVKKLSMQHHIETLAHYLKK